MQKLVRESGKVLEKILNLNSSHSRWHLERASGEGTLSLARNDLLERKSFEDLSMFTEHFAASHLGSTSIESNYNLELLEF